MMTEPPKEHKALYIPTKLIKPNRFNPRTERDKESDQELYDSIRIRGVETPIHVRPVEEDEQGQIYEVFDGDRRRAAAIKAKIATVPVLIEQKSDSEVIEFSLVSIIRRSYNDIEMGRAIVRLLKEFSNEYPSQRSLITKLTMTRQRINQLVLLVTNLDEEAQEYVAPADPTTKRIPEGYIDGRLGTELSKIPNKERQVEAVKEIVAHPELNWMERRLLASEAKEEPETPIDELIERRIAHKKQRMTTLVMSAEEYEGLIEGSRKILIGPTLKPGIHEGTIIEPLVKGDPLEISDVFKRPLGRFKDMDVKNAGFKNVQEFKEAWIAQYGEWKNEQIAYIHLFKPKK